MAIWEFEHSFFTEANRKVAWDYMSDMQNHATEPGVERIELDGPFVRGTKGRTVTKDYTQEWELEEVIDGRRFIITGWSPEGGSLSFAWNFEDEGSGTRMTQRISASGPLLGENLDEFRQMEINAPKAMVQLAEDLNQLAESRR